LARAGRVTWAAIVSIALGIAASTAIFGVASALFLRPLACADADRLVILWNRSPGLGITEDCAVLLLGAVALAASCGPARRASRIDPIASLRAG
jgi:ABC-type antimicrobial peptide transport system permease subunit